MAFQVIGILVLAAFYGCYFVKMFRQKQKGIQTDQMGKGKSGAAKRIEITLAIATIAVPVAEVISIVMGTTALPPWGRIGGAVAAGCGVTVFIFSVLTMRDSWRAGVSEQERTELVTGGIYRISRNPAFLGFDLVYIGILLMFFNPALLAVSAFAIGMLHLQIVKVEEPFLVSAFDASYREYQRQVNRYLGRSNRLNAFCKRSKRGLNMNQGMIPIGRKKTLAIVLAVFLLCDVVKDIEFLVIKTDQTILAENIICKLFILAVLLIVLPRFGLNWKEIGFRKSGILRSAGLGLLLGVSTFFLSYLTEYLVLSAMGKAANIQFFITNFALKDQNIGGASFAAVVICIIGNIVNVWAEEGLFRGLLFRMTKTAFTERQGNLIQSLLFGLWHIVTVVVWLLDGSIGIPMACVMAVGYVLLAGVLAYEWGLCISLTGTIWAGVFEHFFNNFITNSLHMVTDTGIDEMQILRIVLSNVLSLAFVLMLSKHAKRHNRITASC